MQDDDQRVPPPDEQTKTENLDVAESESKLLTRGLYEEAGRRREFRRQEQLRDALASGRVLLARSLPWFALLFIVVMGWHYLGPTDWGWLSPEQIDHIETTLSGVAVSLIVLFLRRYL